MAARASMACHLVKWGTNDTPPHRQFKIHLPQAPWAKEALMGENATESYPFFGVELTPRIFAQLLIELFDGKQFSRKAAIDKVTQHHIDNGGRLEKGNYAPTFKKASQELRECGMTNVAHGIWRLAHKKAEPSTVEVLDTPKITVSVSAKREIGSGDKAVYVYYYEAYKQLALLRGHNSWECKIGRTDVSPLQRIMSQAGTCYPEPPTVALVIYCESSELVESAIHGVLKLRGKWLKDAPGTEWFLTSPEEVESIFENALGAM